MIGQNLGLALIFLIYMDFFLKLWETSYELHDPCLRVITQLTNIIYLSLIRLETSNLDIIDDMEKDFVLKFHKILLHKIFVHFLEILISFN